VYGSQDLVRLVPFNELTRSKITLEEEKRKLTSFRNILAMDKDRVGQLDELLKGINRDISIHGFVMDRIDRMKDWLQFSGEEFIGRMGPITMSAELEPGTWLLRVYNENTFVGRRCKVYADCFSNGSSDYQLYLNYMGALELESQVLHGLVDDKQAEVLVQLDMVMQRIKTYLLKRLSLSGYRPISDDRVKDHVHYSKMGPYRIIPFVIHEIDGVKIFRSTDGYVMFVKEERSEVPVDLLLGFMNENPFNHLRWVNYKVKQSVLYPDNLLSLISKDIELLYLEKTYQQLVGYLGQCEYQSTNYYRALNYLKLSHYYVYHERPSCRAFLLSGEPGIGKSYDVNKIVGNKANVYYYSYDHKTKQYFDGYRGQPIMVIDDIGHYSSDEWLILLKLISDIPFTLPMAVADVKDKIPSLIEEIYITTNCLSGLLALDSISRDAICRRIELIQYVNGNVELGYYSRKRGKFVNYTRMTRGDLYDYFNDYVGMYRQEPRMINKWNCKLWQGVDMFVEILSSLRPEFKILKLYNTIGRWLSGHEVLSEQVIISSLAVVAMDVLPRVLNVQRMRMVLSKDALSSRDVKYVKYEYTHGDLSVLSPTEIDCVKRIAEGNILSYDVLGRNTPLTVNGVELQAPDLSEYIKPIRMKQTMVCPAYHSELLASEIRMLEPDYAGPDLISDSPSYERVTYKTKYYLDDSVPDKFKLLYETGISSAVDRFLKLKERFYSVVDTSWKPTSEVVTKLRRPVVNEFLQSKDGREIGGVSRGSSRTQRRRRQRRHMVAEGGLISAVKEIFSPSEEGINWMRCLPVMVCAAVGTSYLGYRCYHRQSVLASEGMSPLVDDVQQSSDSPQ
jgi:hypothetical protein